MAELFQSGLCMTALTRLVTQSCPSLISAVGCSLLALLGVIQLTAGKLPALASL